MKPKKNRSAKIFAIFLIVLGSMMCYKIADVFMEKEEIYATVTDTYHTHSRKGRDFGACNVEWVDLEGQVQTENRLENKEGAEVGDAFLILVDARTHSKRVLPNANNVAMFVLGLFFLVPGIIVYSMTRKRN